MQAIQVTKSDVLKQKPADESKLGFGKIFTDHMFMMEYSSAKGWHNPRIQPYQPLSLDPATTALHYGQEIFEGLKAYRGEGDSIRLFRPTDNLRRMSNSAERLCMPRLDEELALEGLKQLVRLDADWIPQSAGTSLYIRPTMIATQPFLGVHPSDTYLFFIILSPVGSYYANGLEPIGIWVEDQYVRAVRGGIGSTKAAANYAASLYGATQAEKRGYSQVLWLDGIEHKYVDEVGSMNMFFVFDGELVTAPLGGAILDGITRRSIIALARELGYTVTERLLPIAEIFERGQSGTLNEAFGTGTAAVISPVGRLCWNEQEITINGGEIGPIAQRLYDHLVGIQYGRIADPHGWSVII